MFQRATGYRKRHIKTFTDAEVTVANIRGAQKFLAQAGPNDTLVLFVAGHGIHAQDDDATYYYLTHEADVDNLASSAASFEIIERLLYDSPMRNKLFLLDTCESGEASEDAPPASLPSERGGALAARAVRGLKRVSEVKTSGAASPAAAPRPWLLHRDRLVYTDLARRSGAIVFSSSRGGEFSYEEDAIENGHFTEQLLKALTSPVADKDRDQMLSTDEMRSYVAGAVAEATDQLQHPTVDRDNIHQRFSLPIVSH